MKSTNEKRLEFKPSCLFLSGPSSQFLLGFESQCPPPTPSLRSCIFGFPASLLHPDMFIASCPSPFTTCFYQLSPQSTTKQRVGSLCTGRGGGKVGGGGAATNIVHELLLISIPQCCGQTIPWCRSGRVAALTEGGIPRGENIVQQ